MPAATQPTRTLADRAFEVLRRAGNPFRNYFARNSDDEVCARYHVPELYAREREQLLGVVDLYRMTPNLHSEVVPVLGNKGAGKTHLLHSIKHGHDGAWQLLVTPGTYQRDTDFLEYLLFQLIDTLLGGGRQRGARPLEFVGELVVRGLLSKALNNLSSAQRLDLFPAPGLGKWARRLGLGSSQAQERTQWLSDSLNRPLPRPFHPGGIRAACLEAGIDHGRACDLVLAHIEKTEAHHTAGLMRRHILAGLTRSVLLGDEADLATFLTYGFAELDFKVRPSRQDLVLALFKALSEVLRGLHIPVVVAFDQLEDLLLARRNDESHRTAEAFFAGIVQALHQIDGLCFLVFAERGLWNRFIPSLDGYIQDRLNNPIHLPGHGTIQALRLDAPPAELVRRVVETRMRHALEQVPDLAALPPLFPFAEEQVDRIAGTEPTLRDMLQQFRRLFDKRVFGQESETGSEGATDEQRLPGGRGDLRAALNEQTAELPPTVKSFVVVESPEITDPTAALLDELPRLSLRAAEQSEQQNTRTWSNIGELWEQELRAARAKLEPEGAIPGATRELQAGLGAFLRTCHEHGVKVGPWRLCHVVPEFSYSEHPTFGVLSLAHWVCKDGQPWKVGIGLFLGRGPAKPKDLGVKLGAFDLDPPVVDHLILLRPEDDLSLSGKSKQLWQDAERQSRHARLEPVTLDAFSALNALPRVLAGLTEALPPGQPLPNLAELLQEKCEKLLEQLCMPVQG